MGPFGLGQNCPRPPRSRGPVGNLPFPIRPPAGAEVCAPGNERECTPEEIEAQDELAQADQAVMLSVLDAFARGFVNTRPSPLDAVPFRGKIEELHARAVIAPPTDPGDADGAVGAAAVANAEAAISGVTISTLTPADVDSYVTVISKTVGKGRALVVRGVGAWGHDYYAVRDVIRWRVMASGVVLSKDRELGLAGNVQNPAPVFGVLFEGQTLTVEARNLDTKSASLIEAFVEAWSFPVSPELGNADIMEGLLPDSRRWSESRRQFQAATTPQCRNPEA